MFLTTNLILSRWCKSLKSFKFISQEATTSHSRQTWTTTGSWWRNWRISWNNYDKWKKPRTYGLLFGFASNFFCSHATNPQFENYLERLPFFYTENVCIFQTHPFKTVHRTFNCYDYYNIFSCDCFNGCQQYTYLKYTPF